VSLGSLLAIASLLLASSCRRIQPAPKTPQQLFEGFSISQSYRGRPSWSLKAKTAVLREEVSRAYLSALEMEFYKDSRLSSQLSALSGPLSTDSYDLRLSSSVRVLSLADGSALRTEELLYSSKNRKFFTDKEVFLRRPGGSLRGHGLEANADLSEIRIFNQKAVIHEERR
jgi:LPS export ABC transporter protein LptC